MDSGALVRPVNIPHTPTTSTPRRDIIPSPPRLKENPAAFSASPVLARAPWCIIRRVSTIHTRLLSVIILVFLALPAAHAIGFDTGRLSVTIEGDEAALWTYHLNGAALPIAPPAFSIDGHTLFG